MQRFFSGAQNDTSGAYSRPMRVKKTSCISFGDWVGYLIAKRAVGPVRVDRSEIAFSRMVRVRPGRKHQEVDTRKVFG